MLITHKTFLVGTKNFFFTASSGAVGHNYLSDGKKKLKFTLVQALRLCTGRTAHRREGGVRNIALLFRDHGTRSGEESASRPGRFLSPVKTRYPLFWRLIGPQGRSGQVRKFLPPPEFDPRTVQPVTSRHNYYATRPKFPIVTRNLFSLRYPSRVEVHARS
jgi:hypothetical protein